MPTPSRTSHYLTTYPTLWQRELQEADGKMIGRNERLLEAYRQFLDSRATLLMQANPDKIAEYHWYEFPNNLPLWMTYMFMLEEHSIGISNAINDFMRYIDNLEAWQNVIKDKKDKAKMEIIVEFIAPIATLAINMPNVIHSRFVYSIVHLSHQCNLTKGKRWTIDYPIENEISFKTAKKYCSQWEGYDNLKIALEKIADKDYRIDTNDFRNKYNHRYTLGIELGMTEFIKKISQEGILRYSLGFTQPLKIEQLIPTLTKQHEYCLNALKEYQKLVNEQISAIKNYKA